jgi:rRNA biogenesis protein RRP5
MSSLKRKDAPSRSANAKAAKKSKPSQSSKREVSTQGSTDPQSRASKLSGELSTSLTKSIISKPKDEEPMFPRGGGSVLTPLEQKQIHAEAKADALREVFETEDKPKSRKKRKAADHGLKDKKDTIPSEDVVKIEPLSFKVSVAA